MKYYFGSIATKDAFDTSDMFESSDCNDHLFYYSLEMGGDVPGGLEDVVLEDTCGRSIPIAVEHIPALMEALHKAHTVLNAIDLANDVRDRVEDPYYEQSII